MLNFFLRIYDWLQRHKRLCIGMIIGITGILLLLMATVRYNENINDFIPLSGNEQKAITLYQDISGSKRVVVLFHAKDSTAQDRERLAEAVDTFANRLMQGSGRKHVRELTTQVDYDKIMELSDFVYSNIPLMLSDSDYVAMEQRLADSSYVSDQLAADVQLMMMPATGFFSTNIGNDPLGLFTPVMERLQSRQSATGFEIDNGYIYAINGRYAVAMLTTPYGAMESSNNALLTDYVDSVAQQTMQVMPDVVVEATGAPVISVGNAKQIKADSMLAVTIAVTLILALLVFSFRSWKNLMLIGFAIIFGWAFAMGGLSLVRGEISLIVLGIGSIIIGIAVNYPLHFVAHTDHGGSVRDVLKDMVAPLLIGNITTVGAFAALVPLDAPALHDLGLFAAFMLIGTILFVLIFLPHLVKRRKTVGEERLSFGRLAAQSPDGHRWILGVVAVLTIVLGYFSLSTSFDSNMHHINYMTPEQSRLLSSIQTSAGVNDTANVYVVAEGDTWDKALAEREALDSTIDSLQACNAIERSSNVTAFVCSEAEQARRIARWDSFWNEHRDALMSRLNAEAPAFGFNGDAFEGFDSIVGRHYAPHPIDYFNPLTSMLLSTSMSTANGGCSVVDVLHVGSDNVERVKDAMNTTIGNDGYAFDFVGMNSSIADSLSDNFNYIGYACGLIVFFFLWMSMGRLELSLLSFLPMALGWVWILGIMQIFGMQFNIVNIILATFIFGQGDDYTIFMTDGLINEYAYRRKLLPSYKNSIVISALIMFIGMGSLIVAKHPALYSLAEVTIVGMFTVVLMAWLVPPLVFGWLVRNGRDYRQTPVTFEQIVRTTYSTLWYLFQLLYAAVFGLLKYLIPGGRSKREEWFHRMVCWSMRADINCLDGVKHVMKNATEDFHKGSIAICNHQSILDPIYLLALNPRIVIVVGSKIWYNPIVHHLFRLARFINAGLPNDKLRAEVKRAIDDGYSVVFFPEAARSSNGRILRFHKGPFELAMELHADLLPIYLHGAGAVMPKDSAFAARGKITVEVGQRIPAADLATLGDTSRAIAKAMRAHYVERYDKMKRAIEDAHYFHHFVIYRYIYKGIAVERNTKRLLKRYDDFAHWVNAEPKASTAIVLNAAQGQFALLYALVHPDVEVLSYGFDKDDVELATYCTCLPTNLHIAYSTDIAAAMTEIQSIDTRNAETFLLLPTDNMEQEAAALQPTIVR